jgi:hypothetical protein
MHVISKNGIWGWFAIDADWIACILRIVLAINSGAKKRRNDRGIVFRVIQSVGGNCLRAIFEEKACYRASLRAVKIPTSVQALCASCFAQCKELSTVFFESDCNLARSTPEHFVVRPKDQLWFLKMSRFCRKHAKNYRKFCLDRILNHFELNWVHFVVRHRRQFKFREILQFSTDYASSHVPGHRQLQLSPIPN